MNTRDNIIQATKLLAISSIAFCICCIPLQASPSNYGSVKEQLTACASGVDLPHSSQQQVALNSLRLSADQSVPALKVLFSENMEDQYRTTIIGIFYYATRSQDEVVSFLYDQIMTSPEMKGLGSKFVPQTWIFSSFTLLSKLDVPKALILSRQALNSSNYTVQAMAMDTLGKVGEQEDITKLQAFANGGSNVLSELKLEAKEDIQQITNRLSH